MDVTIDSRTWRLGASLGSGGFGRVYLASSGADDAVVVKLVPKDPGAQRELLFADDLHCVPNVVPVLGIGETADSWAIAMPRAEQSLRDYLQTLQRPLDQSEAIPILVDVAQALVSLSALEIVHRDLKPDNVLLLDGHWCLSDFGISRYAEATTAIDTHKHRGTPQYVAPEQWRAERATPSTDVYAFGVMAYELLTGQWPFSGPDFRDQHLHETPTSLAATIDSPLRSIIDECLNKSPQGRPRAARLMTRLEAQVRNEAPTGGLAALNEAHLRQVSMATERARRESEAKSEALRRADLFSDAVRLHQRITLKLLREVQAAAPAVGDQDAWPLRLGDATLHTTAPTKVARGERLPFDVIAHAEIQVDQAGRTRDQYRGRSHSLWYCDAQHEGVYAWFETGFMPSPLLPDRVSVEGHFRPFAAAPGQEGALQAVGPGMGVSQVAWPFTALIDDDVSKFIDRWAAWFAAASSNELGHPGTMPELPVSGTWRQG